MTTKNKNWYSGGVQPFGHKETGKITTKMGLLYEDGEVVSCREADRLAHEQGLQYAEQLVKKLERETA